MRPRRRVLAAAVLAAVAAPAAADCSPPRPATPAAIESERAAAVDRALRAFGRGGISGAVLMAEGSRVTLLAGYGLADRRCGLPNTPTTAFDVGSIAKTFTAAAVLLLAERGEVDLDASVSRYLPGVPPEKSAITLRQLLSHTSGLDNYISRGDFVPLDRDAAIRRGLALDLLWPPGTSEAYSNAGYALAAAVVERVSGQPFQAFVRQALLAPAGLHSTGWFGESGPEGLRFARGYVRGRQRGSPPEWPLTWSLLGGGGMYLTVGDLHRWLGALFADDGLLGSASRGALRVPVREKWTAGWDARPRGLGPAIQKGGSGDYGFTALVRRYPERELSLVVLLNAYDAPHLGRTHLRVMEAAEAALAGSGPPAPE